jgi:hypothetical protein
MANLKRNIIKLAKTDAEGKVVLENGEVVLETFFSSPFIPFRVVLEATKLSARMQKATAETEVDMAEELINFVAQDIYGKQFTKDDLLDRLHAPDAMQEIQNQIDFVAQGHQSDETKKFLAQKN